MDSELRIIATADLTAVADASANTFVHERGSLKGVPFVTVADSGGDVADVVTVAGATTLADGADKGLVTVSVPFVQNLLAPDAFAALKSVTSSDIVNGGLPNTTATVGLVVANLTMGFDTGSNTWFATQQLTDASSDALVLADTFPLMTAAMGYAFNGATLDRLRTGSAANLSAATQSQTLMVTEPGDWAVNHTPAAGVRATITRAAGAAGVRHVCTSIDARLIGVGAIAAPILVNLRDGATGAGTILWSGYLFAPAAGSKDVATISGLHIFGSAATAMTLEFAAAGGAGDFESVSITGHDVV